MSTSRTGSLIGWLVGGSFVVVSTVQAVSGLMGATGMYWLPLIGGVADLVTSIPVFKQAAVVFYNQQTLAYWFFLLTFGAWLVQGVLMYTEFGRQMSISERGSAGAVAITAIVYGFTFILVYIQLIGTISFVGTAIFFFIPVVATGSLGLAYWWYPWDRQRRRKAVQQLLEAEKTIREAVQEFKKQVDIQTIETLESVAPSAVERARDNQKAFLSRCDDIINQIDNALESDVAQTALERDFDEVRDASMGSGVGPNSRTESNSGDAKAIERRINSRGVEELERIATEVAEEAEAIDVQENVSMIDKALKEAMEQAIDSRFRKVESKFKSPFDEQYAISNMSDRYRQVDFEENTTVVISSNAQNSISSQLKQLHQREDISIKELIEIMDGVDTHLKETVRPYIEQRETKFIKEYEQASELLERAQKTVDKLEWPNTEDMIRSTLIEGTRGENINSATDVEKRINQAKDVLHQCDFEEAELTIKQAVSEAGELNEAVTYLHSVLIPHLERRRKTIHVPQPSSWKHDFLTEELFELLREPLRNDFGAEIQESFSTEELYVQYNKEIGTEDPPTSPPPRGSTASDAVKSLLMELKNGINEEEANTATISLESNSISEFVLTQDPVPELLDFVEFKDGLRVVQAPEVEESGEEPVTYASPGYVKVEATEGSRIEEELNSIVSDYKKWANNEK